MRKEFAFIVLSLFLVSMVSATVELTTPAKDVYNLGETINLPITITADEATSNIFAVRLMCGLKEIEIYKEFLSMPVGAVKERDLTIPLVQTFIGNAKGDCYVEYNLGSSVNRLVENVKISDIVELDLDLHNEKFNPGETLTLTGSVKKENGEGLDGKIEFVVKGVEGGADLTSVTDVKGETFSVSVNVPSSFKFGEHSIRIYAYEISSSGETLSKGELFDKIEIAQIPTTLELFLENDRIQPGTNVVATVLLRDQTGEFIDAKVYAAVKNDKEEIIQKFEERTNVDFVYPVALNQTPAEWIVSVYSEGLDKRLPFKILENPQIEFEILNNTILVKNIGNVPYNESMELNIGNQTVSFYPELAFGEEKTFYLTAPKGSYLVSIGNVVEEVYLTGNAVEISTEAPKFFSLNPVLWIFVLVILLIAIFILIRRKFVRRRFREPNYKMPKERRVKPSKGGEFRELVALSPRVSASASESDNRQFSPISRKEAPLVSSKVKAELALSITGSKQDASVMCLGLRNYYDISNGDGNVAETLQRITEIVEGDRGFVYNSNGAMFFILAPSRTRTFTNESKLLEIANKTRDILKEHNKKFKKKIDFGISLNYGTIVTKEEGGILKFMVLGTFSTIAKKVAMRANEDICLTEDFRKRLPPSVRTEPKEVGGSKVHVVTKSVLGSSSSSGHSTFLEGFVDRHKRDIEKQEKEKQRAELQVPEMPKTDEDEEFSVNY